MGCNPFYICEGANAFPVPGRLKTLKFHLWKMDRATSITKRVNVTELSKYAVFYLTALPLRDIANKQQQAARGTRQTIIQGYNRPLEFYSPIYKDTDAFPQSNLIKDGLFTGILLSGQTVRGKQPSNVITVITPLH